MSLFETDMKKKSASWAWRHLETMERRRTATAAELIVQQLAVWKKKKEGEEGNISRLQSSVSALSAADTMYRSMKVINGVSAES